MLKPCINFLARPAVTVLPPPRAASIVLPERRIPSCVALSKPVAQHFHYLSSSENYLSTVDVHGCGLSVVLRIASVSGKDLSAKAAIFHFMQRYL